MTELLKIKEIIDTKYNRDISKKTRKNGNPDLLKIFFKIARTKTTYSLQQIAMVVNRDHTTVIAQLKKADMHLSTEKLFCAKYNDVLSCVPDFTELRGVTSSMIKQRLKSHRFEIRKLEKELRDRDLKIKG
jgi:hypothetical protein